MLDFYYLCSTCSIKIKRYKLQLFESLAIVFAAHEFRSFGQGLQQKLNVTLTYDVLLCFGTRSVYAKCPLVWKCQGICQCQDIDQKS